jgi:hypothetical protein
MKQFRRKIHAHFFQNQLPAFAMLRKPGEVCFILKFSSGKYVP